MSVRRLEEPKGSFLLIKSFIKSLRWIVALFFLIYLGLILSYLNFLPVETKEMYLQISALFIVIFGLPLSAGFRVDQLSLYLGASMPRELVLFVASLVTWMNLIVIVSFRKWINSKGSKTNTL